MSRAEDRFIAGEGPLAALIRAQPVFEAPPRLLEHILAALDTPPAHAGFEPPAALFDAVMAEAERIDSAQAPRRAALLAELAAGKKASDALGAEVSPATAAWLAQQHPTPAAAPRMRRRRWPWLAGISTALTAALAVSVALRIVQEPAAPPPMPAQMQAPAPAESRTEASAEVIAEPMASTTGAANDSIAFAPKPQRAERLGKAEATTARIARARQDDALEREAKRTAPRPAAPAAMIAGAAPAKPVATPPPAEPMQEAAPPAPALAMPPPAAAPPMMAKALRGAPAMSAPMHVEADETITTDAPVEPIDAPLDITPTALAARLKALPPTDWTLTIAADDKAAGNTLQAALMAELKAAGRADTVALVVGPVPPGRLRITPVE
ncbi:hypothetical protein [Denitromonas halophila]|uniref:Uncharacterized protein n=1 Tax=Denitromonas halophila TaxID=1629404 RepID=A0A557QFC2_9RHOO|nr:hypothetical protein [Denitromonas halophila]TVO51608.1 hypothetical protein FHP91_19285 [Denitromonas halophila]